jgi:RNA-directed DNA polymerase
LGALYLKALDDHFTDKNLYYVRYMDDILILTKTRWHNRKAVKQLNQILNQLKVEKHPDKTYIGKIENGFNFLGYHFNGGQLTVAAKTVEKHVLNYRQLYEQLRMKKTTSDEMASVLGLYVKRWQRWVTAGLPLAAIVRGTDPPTQETDVWVMRSKRVSACHNKPA